MKNYKQWTPAQRWRNLGLYKDAIRSGLWSNPSECRICGQKRGILQTHCIDYDISLAYLPKLLQGTITSKERQQLDQVLVPMCWRCHMMTHKAEHHPLSAKRYFEEIGSGKRYAPVFKPDAWYLLDQHMID